MTYFLFSRLRVRDVQALDSPVLRRCTARGRTVLAPMGAGKSLAALYLRVADVVARFQDHPAKAIDELLPGPRPTAYGSER